MRRNSAAFFGKKSPSGNGGKVWSPPSAKSGGMLLDTRLGDGAAADKYAAKYDPSGPKFSATIDLILDSGWGPDSQECHATLGVPPSMDYQAQYDAKAGPGSAFADTPWDQMNKTHFTWMSDHAPMCMHSKIQRT